MGGQSQMLVGCADPPIGLSGQAQPANLPWYMTISFPSSAVEVLARLEIAASTMEGDCVKSVFVETRTWGMHVIDAETVSSWEQRTCVRIDHAVERGEGAELLYFVGAGCHANGGDGGAEARIKPCRKQASTGARGVPPPCSLYGVWRNISTRSSSPPPPSPTVSAHDSSDAASPPSPPAYDDHAHL